MKVIFTHPKFCERPMSVTVGCPHAHRHRSGRGEVTESQDDQVPRHFLASVVILDLDKVLDHQLKGLMISFDRCVNYT